MALKTHLKIALAWLRYEEVEAGYSLVFHRWLPANPVVLTDTAQSVVGYFNINSTRDPVKIPEGESWRPHYYGIKLAMLTEAILELEELLDG